MRSILCLAIVLTAVTFMSACSDGSNDATPGATLFAGAASRSILPTVNGGRAYLRDAPGWPSHASLDPFDPGVFVAQWDQGEVDVGNGRSDSAWVHDDLRTTALALAMDEDKVVIVMADAYSYFATDITAMLERIRSRMPEDWQDAPVLVSATHNHHGPDTAFSINGTWFALMADEIAFAVEDAIAAVQPATVSAATGEHGYGVDDVRDPVIRDTRLNLLGIRAQQTGAVIATLVQWASHPESTLGWHPPADAAGLDEACAVKGWTGGDCTAEGRYLTADYPGVLRTRLQDAIGGEVLYFNGALGNQVGPGAAPTWVVSEAHPVGDGLTVPEGAAPLTECDDRSPFLCRSFAKTESIGTQLATAVLDLMDDARPVAVSQLSVHTERFYTRLTNIGFRLLIAEGDIGWQEATLFNCDATPLDDSNCRMDNGELIDDPLLTPFFGSQIRRGDVLQTQLSHLDLGDVGLLWMPGELPPELVHGLPQDFTTAPPEKYYREPHLHAVGADYTIPGHLLSLMEDDLTLTIGLGGDQVGYFVPVADYRLSCLDLVLPQGKTCADLAARGVIEDAQWIGGRTCKNITDDASALTAFGDDAEAVAAICRYGQALGREIGEPDGHYEETNAAGWDMVEDLWDAAVRLSGNPSSDKN